MPSETQAQLCAKTPLAYRGAPSTGQMTWRSVSVTSTSNRRLGRSKILGRLLGARRLVHREPLPAATCRPSACVAPLNGRPFHQGTDSPSPWPTRAAGHAQHFPAFPGPPWTFVANDHDIPRLIVPAMTAFMASSPAQRREPDPGVQTLVTGTLTTHPSGARCLEE